MRAKRITERSLKRLGACADQRRRFAEAWPKGAVVGIRAIRKAARLGFDLDWVAEHFLRTPAWAEYDRVTAAARAEYDRVRADELWRLLSKRENRINLDE